MLLTTYHPISTINFCKSFFIFTPFHTSQFVFINTAFTNPSLLPVQTTKNSSTNASHYRPFVSHQSDGLYRLSNYSSDFSRSTVFFSSLVSLILVFDAMQWTKLATCQFSAHVKYMHILLFHSVSSHNELLQ